MPETAAPSREERAVDPSTGGGRSAPRPLVRRLWQLSMWLASGVFGLTLAGGVALWIWAATPGSLAQALSWAERWTLSRSATWGELRHEGAEGSLRGGGRIARLHWTQGEMSVQTEGLELQWGDALWVDALLGRGLHIPSLSLRRLTVDDRRPPSPTEPLNTLTLPLPISLDFAVERFELTGLRTLKASEIAGRYRYAASGMPSDAPSRAPSLPKTSSTRATHGLIINSVRWADGLYRAQITLGALAPMPLEALLQGEVRTGVPDGSPVQLQVLAQASGTLSGVAASIDISAQATPLAQTGGTDSAALSLSARLLPWADQPLHSADVSARSLNIATLWPGAPFTALSGRLRAQPEGAGWRTQIQLDNDLERPADQQGFPLQHLQAEVTQFGPRWTVTDLQARLGKGTVNGQLSFALHGGGTAPNAFTDWQGALTVQGLQPSLLWSTLAPGALDGRFSAGATSRTGAAGAIDLQAQVQASAKQPSGAALAGLSALDMKGQWQSAHGDAGAPAVHGVLELERLSLSAAGARLEGKGRLNTDARTLQGRFGLDLPGARWEWEGLAAHSSGQGVLSAQVNNTADALGWVRSLQHLPWWSLEQRASLALLDVVGADGSGDARLQWSGGLATFGWPAPVGVPVPSVAMPRLQATLNLPGVAFQADKGSPRLTFSEVTLRATGPLDALAVSADGGATVAGWRLTLDTEGQLKAAWPGRGRLELTRLQLRGSPETATLQQPGWRLGNTAPLQLAWSNDPQAGLTLDAGTGGMDLRPLPGSQAAPDTPLTLTWQRGVWQAQSLDTRGRLQGLTMPWLDALTAPFQGAPPLASNGLSGDLVFDGDWDLRLPALPTDPLTLAANLRRRGGDIRWAGGSATAGAPLAAGVHDARLSLDIRNRRLQALLRWDSERLGQASADLSSPLDSGGNSGDKTWARWWPASAPLHSTAQVRLPQVGVWSLLAPPGWRVQGTLSADVGLGGTRGSPEWRGKVLADEMALRSAVDGIAFVNGELRATPTGERLRIDRLSLQGTGGAASGGTLEASGQAEWRSVSGQPLKQPFIELQAKAQRLRISNRPDRRLTLSGDATATLNGPLLLLRGQLKADSALFVLPDESTPSLGADVVVRSTRNQPALNSNTGRVQPDVSVTLDLGPQFEVRGQGLQTRLEGQISLRATPSLPTPRVLGEVRAVNGTYLAYDQKLKIESGVLRFTGPYDDPALDIRAVRVLPEKTEQRVGVQITGNAQAPRVALFSDPDLPDADKLAWLVLGRPASAAGAQAFVLQQAAQRLLSRGGEPLDGALARTLGLDDIGFSGSVSNADGTTTSAALTLGKRLSSDLYLGYEQSLTGAMSTVSILYDLSRRLTLRARAGTENAIDLIFTQRYD